MVKSLSAQVTVWSMVEQSLAPEIIVKKGAVELYGT